MISIRNATPEDVRYVVSRAKEVFRGESDILETSLLDIECGPAFSLLNADGSPACVVGGVRIWAGVARCWAVTTNDLDLHPIAFTRVLLGLITSCVRYYKVHRLEITVKADFKAGIRWAQVLGFRREGHLRAYGPDKTDYLIFGRTF